MGTIPSAPLPSPPLSVAPPAAPPETPSARLPRPPPERPPPARAAAANADADEAGGDGGADPPDVVDPASDAEPYRKGVGGSGIFIRGARSASRLFSARFFSSH